MGMKQWLAAGVVAVCAVTGAWVAMGTGQAPAPESTFVLLDGSQKTTAQMRGKVTLVNFWATSCTTCVAEMPEIINTYEKYKAQGFGKLPFQVAIDNTGANAKAWGDVKLTPSTFIVNKRGEIVKTYVGAPNFTELHQLIERLLSEA